MTYGELKDFVLQLLNRYSVAGETVADSYNDQADIKARIPALVRDGLLYLATSCRRMREVAPLTEPKKVGENVLYQLPDDCYQIIGGLLRKDGTRLGDYRLVGSRQIMLSQPGTYLVEYFRYPVSLCKDPDDDAFLDCPPEAQMALAYYVASHLAMEDNNYLHGVLYNEFEVKLLRLQEGLTAQSGQVEDVYG